MRNDRSVPWILKYRQRKLRSRKMLKTENEIQEAKQNGDWKLVTRLKYLLRNAWWGHKRIKNK
jgi:hypothetical protein